MLRQIWSPQDAVDTAHQFHLELHNAERGARYCVRCDKSQLVVKVDTDGVCRNCKRRGRVERLLFSRSRFRRAGIMDTLTVGLLVVMLAALGWLYAIAWAPSAKADVTDPQVIAFTAVYGGSSATCWMTTPRSQGSTASARASSRNPGCPIIRRGR